MKKIIFCDIDKTLIISKEISEENKNMVKKYSDNGGLFILVSGRGVKYTKEIVKK